MDTLFLLMAKYDGKVIILLETVYADFSRISWLLY